MYPQNTDFFGAPAARFYFRMSISIQFIKIVNVWCVRDPLKTGCLCEKNIFEFLETPHDQVQNTIPKFESSDPCRVAAESIPKESLSSDEIVQNPASVFTSKTQPFHKSGIGARIWEQFSNIMGIRIPESIHENPRAFFVMKSFRKQRFWTVSRAKLM